MNIQHAMLGLLRNKPLTGYDMKKAMQNSPFLYWSGNNSQISVRWQSWRRKALSLLGYYTPCSGRRREVWHFCPVLPKPSCQPALLPKEQHVRADHTEQNHNVFLEFCLFHLSDDAIGGERPHDHGGPHREPREQRRWVKADQLAVNCGFQQMHGRGGRGFTCDVGDWRKPKG